MRHLCTPRFMVQQEMTRCLSSFKRACSDRARKTCNAWYLVIARGMPLNKGLEGQTYGGPRCFHPPPWYRFALPRWNRSKLGETSRTLLPRTMSAIQDLLPSLQRRRSVLGRRNLRQSPRLSILCFEYNILAGERARHQTTRGTCRSRSPKIM